MNKSVDFGCNPLFSSSHLNIWNSSKSSPIQEVVLQKSVVDELVIAAENSTDDSFTQFSADELSITIGAVSEIRTALESSGVVIIDRLPVEKLDISISRRAAAILSNLITPLMAQDINGTLMYDVVDEGGESDGTTRRSKTNVEQPFHTDGPWHRKTACHIGLFCLQPAEKGGYSQVSSLEVSLDNIFREDAEAQSILENNLPWNKMGQFTADELPYSCLPMISRAGGKTLIRHYADYVRTGHDLANVPMTSRIAGLLSKVDEELSKNACEPFRLEAGQIQYVNNRCVAHARAAFADDDVTAGRHLVRLWNREID